MIKNFKNRNDQNYLDYFLGFELKRVVKELIKKGKELIKNERQNSKM